MTLAELLKPIKTTKNQTKISGLCLNSADIEVGDLFIALQGQNAHGVDFIAEAILRGCAAVITDSVDLKCQVPSIKIDNLSQHLPCLSSRFYPNAKKVEVIGITGTNGKTSVGFFIQQMLEKLGVKSIFIGTLDGGKTTPDIISLHKRLQQFYEFGQVAILEVSSHSLMQNRVKGLNFKQAIFTNLTHDHLDYHQTFEAYKQAKIKLFQLPNLQNAIVNEDDLNHQDFLAATTATTSVFSVKKLIKAEPNQHGFLCQLDSFVFELPLLGGFNLSNILAAVKSLELLGFSRNKIIPLLAKITPPKGRMQQVENKMIWVDFAHTENALEVAIKALKVHYPDLKVRVIFGCGGGRCHDKRAKMGAVASKLADDIILTTDNPRDEAPLDIIEDIRAGISDEANLQIIADRRLAIETSVSTLKDDECLLIAGRGGENYQIIAGEKHPFNDFEVAKNA